MAEWRLAAPRKKRFHGTPRGPSWFFTATSMLPGEGEAGWGMTVERQRC